MHSEFLSQPLAISPEILCQTVFLLHRHAHSGQLIITLGHLSHTLCWIDGRLVAYQSDFPEFKWLKLLAANPKAPLLPDGISSPQEVLSQGYVSLEQWQKHLDFCLAQALIRPLAWSEGSVRFIKQDIDGRTVDPHLLQKISVLPVLFQGVKTMIPDTVRRELVDGSVLQSTEPLMRWLFAFQVPNQWSKLAKVLTNGVPLPRLLAQFNSSMVNSSMVNTPMDLRSFMGAKGL